MRGWVAVLAMDATGRKAEGRVYRACLLPHRMIAADERKRDLGRVKARSLFSTGIR